MVELGGEPRTLVFDHNAICELEELNGGKSLGAILGFGDEQKLKENFGYSMTRKGLYCGLLRNYGRGLTLEKVGRWMDESPDRFAEYVVAVLKSLALAANRSSESSKKPVGGESADPTTAAVV